MVEVLKIMVTSFKKSYAGTATPSAPNPAAGHRRPMPLPETPRHSRQVCVSLLWGHCSFLLGPGMHKFCLCPLRVCFPVLCKFWWLYGGVNGNLLQEGLRHTQVCCTQISCLSGRSLLTCSPTGDAQTQFWLSLCGALVHTRFV